MATLLKADGSSTEVSPKNGKDFSLEELYSLIGCELVELVQLPKGRTMWLDEEGKLKHPPKPRNSEATVLLHMAGGSPMDYIAGDALICEGWEVE